MFWGFRLRDEIKERYASEIAAHKQLIIRDEKTMSGRVHVGSLRGVVIHGIISELLNDAGIANRYIFEINDFDPMDSLPLYVDQKKFKPFMGRLLVDVPSPDETAVNYPEYFAGEFIKVISGAGFTPSYYRSSTLYRQGKYNDAIRLALDHTDVIRTIYKEVSGSVKEDDWFPLQVVCEKCGKVGTTKVTGWDGNRVSYSCLKTLVKWAKGCGHKGTVDPFDGRAKLPWKVEWAVKFMVQGVHIEGAGKDHYTKGGSRDVVRRILQEVFHYPEPLDVPYNFFAIGGKKMSSSKGMGSSAKDVSDILPAEILRMLLMREPKKEIDFDPYGDTIPILFDTYDKIAHEYFAKQQTDWSAVFPYFQKPEARDGLKSIFYPRFSQIAYLAQMPHINLAEKVAAMKGSALTDADRLELEKRSSYAKKWLSLYSPEKYKFDIQEKIPKKTVSFSDLQKQALREVAQFMQQEQSLDGDRLHAYLHELKQRLGIPPADLFPAIYLSILGKNSGPQAGWFLFALDRDFVIKRLNDVSQS